MTGAGAPGAPGIIRCLLRHPSMRLTVGDADPQATGRWLHPDFIQLPKADDPSFADQLLDHCNRNHINILMPLVTRELLPLALRKKDFEAIGTRVLVSDPESISIANNKARTYEFLQSQGIEVPRFFTVHTIEEFVHAAFELGHPQRPFCFKPAESNGSRGVRIVNDALDEVDLLFHHKPYQLDISYTHALSILSSRPFPQLLLSDYLPGMEYSVDCLADHGSVRMAVPRTREKMNNGISIRGRFEKNEAVISYCTRIIEVLKLHGNIGIQVKCNEEGKPLLLEINPRVQGTIVAALGAGVNLPLLAVWQELGQTISSGDLEVQWGKGFARYWNEVFY